MPPLNIESRLELFVDDYLVDQLSDGAALRLHTPQPKEVALVYDRPWEGNTCGYVTVFRDYNRFRMYYRGSGATYLPDGYLSGGQVTCVAESTDGIHWERPELDLFEVGGHRRNNVVLTSDVGGKAVHNLCPHVDPRREIPDAERYKALGGGKGNLLAFSSPDGIHWTQIGDSAVITDGAFDSQNLAFWDTTREEYRAYIRDFREGRDIKTCTSADFREWTEPQWLNYTPGRVSELYTNQIQPYYRAPHIFLGFPTRYVQRPWQPATDYLPHPEYRRMRARVSYREGTAVTDGIFMSSRDRQHFHVWEESFLRPGLWSRDGWFYGDNYQSLGLIETPSDRDERINELSFFVSEGSHQPTHARLRRHTVRIDGFVSVSAPLRGGELITKPLLFTGRKLLINYATGAAGSVRVEVQDAEGTAIEGYTLDDAEELFGDSLEQPVLWKHGTEVGSLEGKPIRLRFVLADADLYSLRFTDPATESYDPR